MVSLDNIWHVKMSDALDSFSFSLSLSHMSLPSCSEVLGEFMEGRGAVTPGILTLTTGLSKQFMRLDKYPTLLKELERHMEVGVCNCVQTCLKNLLWCLSGDQRIFVPFSGGPPWQSRHSEVHGIFQKLVRKLNTLIAYPFQSERIRHVTTR